MLLHLKKLFLNGKILIESKNRATAISVLSLGIGIVYVLLVWGLGPIIEWFGDTRIVFTLFGLLSLGVILPLGISLTRNNAN